MGRHRRAARFSKKSMGTRRLMPLWLLVKQKESKRTDLRAIFAGLLALLPFEPVTTAMCCFGGCSAEFFSAVYYDVVGLLATVVAAVWKQINNSIRHTVLIIFVCNRANNISSKFNALFNSLKWQRLLEICVVAHVSGARGCSQPAQFFVGKNLSCI